MWRAQRSRVSSPRVSTSAASLGVHGHARPLIAWRAGCSRPERLWPPAPGGGQYTRLPAASVPRRRLAAATALGVAGWEASMRVPSGCTASGGRITRPVSPLEYGMIDPHDASCTMSADALCHNPPIPCKGGMDALLRPVRVSQPETAGLSPARAPAGSALLSKQSRTEPSGTSMSRNCAKSRCHIWLWTRLMR
jgi:hypothetical protein